MNYLKNWIPYQLKYEAGAWMVSWLNLGDHEIMEPFFDETINICRAHMMEKSKFKSQSSIDFLVQSATLSPSLQPTAFIFHVSRCGSTLLSQALAIEEKNIVIAEAPILDEILRAGERDAELKLTTIAQWFKAALIMMGQNRTGEKQQYFIKLDSWHLHFYGLLRSWFPEVPFYFLTREPIAIIESHEKRRGIHAVPNMINPKLLKIDLNESHYANFNFYTATLLKVYYETLLAIKNEELPLNNFYDYGWGIEGMMGHFFKAVGLNGIPSQAVSNRLAFHSKFPDQVFKADHVGMEPTAYPATVKAYDNLLSVLTNHS